MLKFNTGEIMIDLNYLYCFSRLNENEDDVSVFDYMTAQAFVRKEKQDFSRFYEGIFADRICECVDKSNIFLNDMDLFVLELEKNDIFLTDFLDALVECYPKKSNALDIMFYKWTPKSRIFSSFNELRARGNDAYFVDVKFGKEEKEYSEVAKPDFLFYQPAKIFGIEWLIEALRGLELNDENDDEAYLSDKQIVSLCLPFLNNVTFESLGSYFPNFDAEDVRTAWEEKDSKVNSESLNKLIKKRNALYKKYYNYSFANSWDASYNFADGLISIDENGYEEIDFEVDNAETIPYSDLFVNVAKKQEKEEDLKVVKNRFAVTKEQCDNFKYEIVGQTEAKNLIVDKLVSVTCGFGSDEKPVATLLLNGPTGVGKTQTAKSIAKNFFGGKIYTIDMTNFKNSADMAILTGSAPGYIGYNDKNPFIEFVKENPRSVLLFDEIDKASPSVLPFMMRLLDEGKFTSAKGEVLDVSGCVIVATTNQTANVSQNSPNKNLEELSAHSGDSGSPFLKEFMGRFDEILNYSALTAEEMRMILKQKLDKRIKDFESQTVSGIKLGYGDQLIEDILVQANAKVTGARALNSSIQKLFIRPLSYYILNNKAYGANIVVESKTQLTVDDEKVELAPAKTAERKEKVHDNALIYFG